MLIIDLFFYKNWTYFTTTVTLINSLTWLNSPRLLTPVGPAPQIRKPLSDFKKEAKFTKHVHFTEQHVLGCTDV